MALPVVTATFSENVNAPPPLVVTNGSVVGDVEKESDSVFLYTIKPLLNGNITATIHADTCIDADGNGNKESNTLSFVSNYYSVDPPRVSLAFAGRTSTNAANPTLDISATFSEPVTGFDTSKILVTNGQARSLAGSGSEYLFTIQPTPPEGDVNVTVDAGAARDEIDRPNTASNSLTFAHDAVPPTCTIQMAGEVSSAVTVTAVFSEPVMGLEADKFLVVNATIAGFTAENASAYSFVLTPAEGDVSLQLPEGAAVDGAGNPNSASNTLEFTYAVPPTVELVLSTPASYRQLAAVTATFSETVSGDMANALTVTGGAVEGVTSSDGRVHLYTIKPAINGAITAEVKANACTDVYGNPNVKSSVLEFISEYYPLQPPSVTLAFADRTATNIAHPNLVVNAVFSAPVTGFHASGVVVENGQVSGFSGSGSEYSFFVTSTLSQGVVTLHVPAGAAVDEINRANLASASLDFLHDGVAPTCVITVMSSTSNSATVTAEFSEPVTGFALADLDIYGGIASDLVAVGGGMSYSFTLTANTAINRVDVSLPPGSVTDVAGNENSEEARATFFWSPSWTPPTNEMSDNWVEGNENSDVRFMLVVDIDSSCNTYHVSISVYAEAAFRDLAGYGIKLPYDANFLTYESASGVGALAINNFPSSNYVVFNAVRDDEPANIDEVQRVLLATLDFRLNPPPDEVTSISYSVLRSFGWTNVSSEAADYYAKSHQPIPVRGIARNVYNLYFASVALWTDSIMFSTMLHF
eukprot:jgi/Mesvir1/766/Mv17367-RA.1